MKERLYDLVIVGGGPVGLEAALAADEAGLDFALLEQGSEIGAGVRSWGHVRLFSPWHLDASERMRRALGRTSWAAPDPDACPTGDELVERLLEPLAELPRIASRLHLGRRVAAIGRHGLHKAVELSSLERARRPFRLLTERPAGGGEEIFTASAVIDCSGSLARPLWLGNGGIPAPGERAAGGRIERRLPDFAAEAESWLGSVVVVAGAGHSAQTAVVELEQLAREAAVRAGRSTRIHWLLRRSEAKVEVLPDDPLPARAELNRRASELLRGASPFVVAHRGTLVERIDATGSTVRLELSGGPAGEEVLEADRVLSLVGSVGDHAIYRELQVHECWATSGPMRLAAQLLGESGGDCLAAASGGPELLVNPEPGFFIAGSKSYGRNSAFLLRTGYQQIDDVLALLTHSRCHDGSM